MDRPLHVLKKKKQKKSYASWKLNHNPRSSTFGIWLKLELMTVWPRFNTLLLFAFNVATFFSFTLFQYRQMNKNLPSIFFFVLFFLLLLNVGPYTQEMSSFYYIHLTAYCTMLQQSVWVSFKVCGLGRGEKDWPTGRRMKKCEGENAN